MFPYSIVQNGAKSRQADPSIASQMGSPFSGTVSAIFKDPGTQVSQDEVILSISAIKMTLNVGAPFDGFLRNLDAKVGDSIEKGDFLFEASSSH